MVKWPFAVRKCKLCGTVLKPEHSMHQVRIDTSEGILELEVCAGCALVLDKSADVLMKKQPKETDNG